MSHKAKRRVSRRRKPPASGRKPLLPLTPHELEAIGAELADYHHLFHPLFQRREQRQWSALYLCGQLSDLERKTIEPMVLTLKGTHPNAVRAVQQFIGQGRWETQAIVWHHQRLVAESLGDAGGVVIVDGSGFLKQGEHSAGVARQYCGCVGKIANCQEGVFAVYAARHGYTFLDGRLYLPESWFEKDHRQRWQQCGIPDEVGFHTEPELALEMVTGLAVRDIVPFQWVTCDEHFGQNPAFLDDISALRKWYLAEVPCDTRAWLHTPRVEPPGRGLLGRPRTHPRVSPKAPRPREVREMATRLPASAWTRYTIQEGSKGPLVAEFAFLRVTTVRGTLPGPRVWAVFRRSLAAQPELKFYLSNAPLACAQSDLAQMSSMRWPIEMAFEEAKGELGMDHYETRTWRGWHHHMAHVFLAHHFLMRLRLRLKKKPGTDHRASAPVGITRAQERRWSTGYARHRRLPPASQPCGLPFSSQAYA